MDTQGRDPRAVPGAPAPPRVDAAAFSSSLPPTQREIEGAGGEMWRCGTRRATSEQGARPDRPAIQPVDAGLPATCGAMG